MLGKNISRIILRFKQCKLAYHSYGEKKYYLTSTPGDCYVKLGKTNIGAIETMKIIGDELHIDHFAVFDSEKGKGLGEKLIRGFAELISKQNPSIQTIVFDLYRAGSNADKEKLANARENLLSRIGANDVKRRYPNKNCVVVSGRWPKDKWIKGYS